VAVGAAESGGPALLALRALGLGDLLAAVPAYRGLRRAFPDHRLVLAGPPALEPLALLTSAVDEVLATPGPGQPGHLDPPAWRGAPPDLAVNLHGCGPRSTVALRSLGPRRLWSYAHPDVPVVDGPVWRAHEHEVARWCRLLAAFGVDADPADLDLPPPPRPSPAPGAVVVHPGAAYGSRRWPVDRFAAVAAELHRDGHRVVVTGTAAERARALRVADTAGLDRRDVLAGWTGPLDLAALVASARLVVCGDTGVGHLATAYRTRSVLLFGPTPPAEWGPPRRREHAVLWHGDGPADPFAGRPDPALLRIRPGEVLASARDLLGAPAAPAAAAATAAPAGRPCAAAAP